MSTCSNFHNGNSTVWSEAVSHPFLEQCRSGTLDIQVFDRWLVQDYLFVLEFTRFVALAITKAPYHHFETLLGGLVALKDEITWFRGCLESRDINLEEQAAKAPCQEYIDYMRSCTRQPYAVHITTLWAIEKAYHDAWNSHQPSQAPYDYFTERWASEPFSRYVVELQAAADDALGNASREERMAARVAFINVCRLESGFWAMAYEK